MKINLRLIIIAIIAAIGGNAYADSPDYDALEAEIRDIMQDVEIPGLGIAVVSNDSIIYQNSFGYRVLPDSVNTQGELLENDDFFRIASVSKTFIATAIMRLAEDGMLNLNDDAQKYLDFPLRNPKFPNDTIKIKQLLTHTSSINDNRSWWNLDVINPEIDPDFGKCFSDWAPGNGYKYCNMNYALLGCVIEGITGRRFDTVVDDVIMKPLELQGGFNVNLLPREKLVHLYARNAKTGEIEEIDEAYRPYTNILGKDYKLRKSLGLEYPSSGMKINTESLAKYMMMHMDEGALDGVRIISGEDALEMQKNHVPGHNYGYAFCSYPQILAGKVLYGQTGGGTGIKTAMIFDRDEKYGFVILASGGNTEKFDGFKEIHQPIIRLLYQYLIADE